MKAPLASDVLAATVAARSARLELFSPVRSPAPSPLDRRGDGLADLVAMRSVCRQGFVTERSISRRLDGSRRGWVDRRLRTAARSWEAIHCNCGGSTWRRDGEAWVEQPRVQVPGPLWVLAWLGTNPELTWGDSGDRTVVTTADVRDLGAPTGAGSRLVQIEVDEAARVRWAAAGQPDDSPAVWWDTVAFSDYGVPLRSDLLPGGTRWPRD